MKRRLRVYRLPRARVTTMHGSEVIGEVIVSAFSRRHAHAMLKLWAISTSDGVGVELLPLSDAPSRDEDHRLATNRGAIVLWREPGSVNLSAAYDTLGLRSTT